MKTDELIDKYLDESIISKIKDGAFKAIYFVSGNPIHDPQVREYLKKGYEIESMGKANMSFTRNYSLRLVNNDTGDVVHLSSSPDPKVELKIKSRELTKLQKDGWEITSQGVSTMLAADFKQHWVKKIKKCHNH